MASMRPEFMREIQFGGINVGLLSKQISFKVIQLMR